MSHYNVYINPPGYLAQWLRHEYWDEETGRVVFPRGSAPRVVMQSLLRKPPKGWKEVGTIDSLKVEVPSMKGINASSFNYLSDAGKVALISACKKLFQAMLFNELHELFFQDVKITDIIYAFMERHGIENDPKHWETIRQMYARMRKKTFNNQS